MTPTVPASIGRFRVDNVIGQGGMGEVYLAFDPILHRTVAIKTVRPGITDPEYLDRLHREAQACGGLQHSNIVTVYEAGTIGDVVFIVMEYLKGENLAQVLDRGELSFEAKLQVLMQILDALHYAHIEGVIHRDVKPSNVHLMPDHATVKLLDFGLARVSRAETLTQSRMMMGTPYYASPEQLRGERVDARSDVYSTGVLAYEMFARRRAFDGDSLGSVVAKVLMEPAPPIRNSWTRAFPEIERIVFRAMAKSADDRYATAEEMRNDLAAFLATSRDAIHATQAELNLKLRQVVSDANDLIETGRVEESRTLLSTALGDNPDAVEIRNLLEKTSGRPVIALADAVTEPNRRAAMVLPRSEPQPVEQPVEQRVVAPESSSAGQTSTAPAAAGARHRRPLLWTIAAGLLLAAGLAAKPMLQRRITAPESASVAPAAAPIAPAAAPQTIADDTATPASVIGSSASRADVLPAAAPLNRPTEQKDASAPTRANEPRLEAASRLAPSAAPSAKLSAKQLFYSATEATPSGSPAGATKSGAVPPTGLRYRLISQLPSGNEIEVDPDTAFQSGDRVRFTFESNSDGYLYVVQEGSSGQWTVLFPHPQINGGNNLVRRLESYAVPSKAWFAFDANPGTERLFVLFSKEPMSELPGFSAPITKPATVSESVVARLSREIASRDLVLQKDDGTAEEAAGARPTQVTYVVNRDQLGKEVAVTIRLVHK
jgi:serine/threonine protein kinase